MTPRTASNTAWLAAATHVVALAAMLFCLRGGLPGPSDDERLAHMAAHPLMWAGGWVTWHVAAIALVAFYAVLALRFRGVLSATAMGAVIAGLAIDIASESRYIGVLPSLRGDEFAALDRELEVLIGYGANGLYTVAFVLLVIAGRRELPRIALVLSGPVAAAGFALAIASLQHDPRLETITSAALFPLFILWTVVVALWLRNASSS